ncbi:MAG: hypothetical protein AAFX06_21130 [Planctomycetota bacterium]
MSPVRWGLAAACIGVALLIDVVMCAVLLSDLSSRRGDGIYMFFGFAIGSLAGKAALAAAWFAFSAHSVIVRMGITFCAFVALVSTWLIGLAVNNESQPLEITVLTFAFCAVSFAAVVGPMWVAQRLTQRTLRPIGQTARRGDREQFSIRSMMVITGGIAVLLAVGRYVLAHQSLDERLVLAGEVLMPLTALVLGFGNYVTLLVLPMMAVFLGKPRIHPAWLLFAVFAFLVAPFALSETLFVVPGVGRPPKDIYWWVVASPFAFGIAVMLMGLCAISGLRYFGYRLQPIAATETERESIDPTPLPSVEL